jgi:membrane-bound inhibitor of C-type lysozyme
MTFRKVVFFIVIIILIVIIGYSFIHKSPIAAPVVPVTTPAPVVTSTATFSCDGGSTIIANFSDSSVALTLSDGRQMTLPHIMAADGAQYEQGTTLFVNKGDQATLEEAGTTTYNNCITGTAGTTTDGRKTFTDQGKLFTFSYPQAFSIVGGGIGYTENWKTNTDGTLGLILAQVNVPQTYQPKTNFGDAKFTVGTSVDAKAIKNCLTDMSGSGVTKSTVTINNITYTKFVSTDAGAGNRYETTSYRTVQDNQCFALEYTIHYAELANFDPSTGVTAYNSVQVHNDLDSIVQSFNFLPQTQD